MRQHNMDTSQIRFIIYLSLDEIMEIMRKFKAVQGRC